MGRFEFTTLAPWGRVDVARSEALECVQLAAAFAPASLLAGIRHCTEIKPMKSEMVMPSPASKLAGKESGSKLHALQSFAPRQLSGPRLEADPHRDYGRDRLAFHHRDIEFPPLGGRHDLRTQAIIIRHFSFRSDVSVRINVDDEEDESIRR